MNRIEKWYKKQAKKEEKEKAKIAKEAQFRLYKLLIDNYNKQHAK